MNDTYNSIFSTLQELYSIHDTHTWSDTLTPQEPVVHAVNSVCVESNSKQIWKRRDDVQQDRLSLLIHTFM